MSPTLSWADVLFRLALGFSAGLLVGLDRGEHAHPAGLRTTILVSVAATAAMIQANWLVVHTTDTQISILRLDMMRLPLGILSGIGFIGAGAILHPARGQRNDYRLGHSLADEICRGCGPGSGGAVRSRSRCRPTARRRAPCLRC
jgi:hypothetical protein